MKQIKNYAQIIAKMWNKPVNKAQVKRNEHAPVELNGSPTLIHVDASVRMFKLMQEELFEYKEACREENLIEVIDAIFDMQFVLDGIKAQHGLQDVQEYFMDEVVRSNLSKLEVGEMKMSEIGKVLKPDTFSAPQLGTILKQLQ